MSHQQQQQPPAEPASDATTPVEVEHEQLEDMEPEHELQSAHSTSNANPHELSGTIHCTGTGTGARGDWGEGRTEQVDVDRARAEFQEIVRTVSTSSQHADKRKRKEGSLLSRFLSGGGGGAKEEQGQEQQQEKDVEAQKSDGADAVAKQDGQFDLGEWILNTQAKARSSGKEAGYKPVGLAWNDLAILAPAGSGGGVFNKDLPIAIANTVWRDPIAILTFLFPPLARMGGSSSSSKKSGKGKDARALLQGQMGVLKASEMLLVLGRPGSGCTTMLRALTSNSASNVSTAGSLTYGGYGQEYVREKLRGEVIFIDEEDTHFPTLTVAQTLRFALRNKVPHRDVRIVGDTRRDFIEILIDVFLNMFAMSHVRHTIVGDAAVRGVSGGERKRVTLSEGLATGAAIVAHDNATRGLDASTALEYARSLRIITDLTHRTTIATLYQVSESIYDLFDRVCVIDAGRCIYYGPRARAREYFEALGYYAPPRQTTADFVTAVTDPDLVDVREGWEHKAPRTPEEREAAWRASALYAELQAEYEAYMRQVEQTEAAEAKRLKEVVRAGKNKGVAKSSPYTVPFTEQVKATIIRQLQIKWAAREEFRTKTIIVMGVSFIISSLFYNQPFDSSGTFTRGGILLFSCLFVGWLQLSEAFEAVGGRPILFRHKQFAFARPSAMVIARALVDIPQLLILTTIFSVIVYFLAHLRIDAGAFWLYYLFVLLSSYNFTALYRMVASLSPGFNEAIRFSVLALNVCLVAAGYVLPKKAFNWTIFLVYIQGISYAFEGFMANEFRYPIQCAAAQIIPFNMMRDARYQTCALAGAQPGQLTVDPQRYLQTSYGYSQGNIGRSIGALIGFTALYLLITVLAAEALSFQGTGGVTVFARTKRASKQLRQIEQPREDDVEAKAEGKPPSSLSNGNGNGNSDNTTRVNSPEPSDNSNGNSKPASSSKLTGGAQLTAAQTNKYNAHPVFTWQDVNLELASGRKLLQNVDGYVKPGRMTALMGASGAGKTTLMSALSQRAVAGKLEGQVLVDGKPLGPGFQKSTGFVLQADIHLATQTVREAVEFAALLRQPAEVPREKKLQDAQTAIELLELQDLQDALIGSPGAGLNVEKRKRISIALEIASKPDLLLFLDEPTSGLDSAGAASICRLLRRLAEDGQAILCTIHQPSVEIFESFDDVVLLQEGGRLTYAGPIGDDSVNSKHRNSKVVREYFESHCGDKCPPDANVAEYLLETVSGRRGEGTKWNERWLESDARKNLRKEIDRLVDERKQRPMPEDSRARSEFSANAFTQIAEVTKRQFRDVWRDSSYAYGILFSNFVLAFVCGGIFAHIGFKSTDLQSRVFVVFLVILSFPAVINSVISKLFELRMIYEARESPSKTFAWWAFLTSFLVTSMPIAVVASVLYFLPAFYLPFYSQSSSTAGYFYLMTLMLNIFEIEFSLMLAVSSPTPVTASNILPFLLPILAIVNGVIVPQPQLPQPWKSVYWANPVAYYIRGQVANILHDIPVVCEDADTYRFDPPQGQSCDVYAGSWATSAGGYLVNPNDTSNCGYCQYSSGESFAAQLNAPFDFRYPAFVVVLGFCIFNVFATYALFWFFRVHGGFSLAPITKLLRWPLSKLSKKGQH